MHQYLVSSTYVNWNNQEIMSLAESLSSNCTTDGSIAKNCFEWVRDNIKHSVDYKMSPITCKASDVLQHKTGYCYAKSHLLAALLRANGLPAGLCYQRLSVGGGEAPYCLHGLNAVYLKHHGWYRMDARGNTAAVNAQFSPPHEQLAFALNAPCEIDLPEIWAEPLPVVVAVLEKYKTWDVVYQHLPDIEIIPTLPYDRMR